MLSGVVGKRRVLLCVLPLLALGGLVGERAATPTRHTQESASAEIPTDLTNLMQRATAAINQRRPDQLASIATDEALPTFAWARRSHTKWTGDVLPIPLSKGANAQTTPVYLAVFHAWHDCEGEGDHIHRLTLSQEGWRLGAEIPESDPGGYRVRDHEMQVALDISHKSVDIQDRIQMERTAEKTPEFGMLRLSEDFRVRTMTEDHFGGAPVSYRQVGGVIAYLPPGDPKFTLALHYAGVVDHRGSGDFVRNDEATLSSYWYPHTARLPATTTITATAPPGWTALAQGELVKSTRNPEGTTTVTYRNDLPVSYYSLDVGRYTVISRQAKGVLLSVYLLDPNSVLAQQCLNTTRHALEYYETHFGKFPYTRYGVVQTRGGSAGALEAYSFATFGPQTLPSLIPHELSHTWWGGRIPCAYTRSMWNEAFAEYSDSLFQATQPAPPQPEQVAPVNLAERRRKRAGAFDACPLDQAYDTNDNAQIEIGYGKGLLVMQTLEAELGQEAMLRCMAAFLRDHPSGEAAEWPEFEAAVNKTTGQNYHWFFEQWVERPGMPNVHWENVVCTQSGRSTRIEADIVQEGTPYRLKIPCSLTTSRGKPLLFTQPLSSARTHVQWTTDSPPVRMALDPGDTLSLSPPPNAPDDSDPTVYIFPRN